MPISSLSHPTDAISGVCCQPPRLIAQHRLSGPSLPERVKVSVASVGTAGPANPRTGSRINCLWLSKIGGRTVGMTHLVGADDQTISITLLRVDPEYHHTAVLTNLVQYIHDFCCAHGCSMLDVESHVAPRWVLRHMEGRGFRLVRRKQVCGEDVLEFRVDTRWEPARDAAAPLSSVR